MTVPNGNLFCKSNLLHCANLERNYFQSSNNGHVSPLESQFGRGKTKEIEAITCEMEGGSRKEKKNHGKLLLWTVSIGTDNMMHLQVDSSSGPCSKTDLLCNKL